MQVACPIASVHGQSPWRAESGPDDEPLFKALQGLVDALEQAPGLLDPGSGDASSLNLIATPSSPGSFPAQADGFACAADIETDTTQVAAEAAVAEAGKAQLVETTATEYEVRFTACQQPCTFTASIHMCLNTAICLVVQASTDCCSIAEPRFTSVPCTPCTLGS